MLQFKAFLNCNIRNSSIPVSSKLEGDWLCTRVTLKPVEPVNNLFEMAQQPEDTAHIWGGNAKEFAENKLFHEHGS